MKSSVLVLQKRVYPNDNQPAAFGAFSQELGVDDLPPRARDRQIHTARERDEHEIHELARDYQEFLRGRPVRTGRRRQDPPQKYVRLELFCLFLDISRCRL